MTGRKKFHSDPIIGSCMRAVIFDLDGVVTDTAEAHARAWKQMFDNYLDDLKKWGAGPQSPFDIEDVTDEDTFRILQRYGAGIVVHGGEKHSSFARCGLQDPAQGRSLLKQLAESIGGDK